VQIVDWFGHSIKMSGGLSAGSCSTTVTLWARVMWPRANSVLLLIGTRFLEKWVPQARWGPPDSTEPLKLVDLG
jgi:hypothetical protein